MTQSLWFSTLQQVFDCEQFLEAAPTSVWH